MIYIDNFVKNVLTLINPRMAKYMRDELNIIRYDAELANTILVRVTIHHNDIVIYVPNSVPRENLTNVLHGYFKEILLANVSLLLGQFTSNIIDNNSDAYSVLLGENYNELFAKLDAFAIYVYQSIAATCNTSLINPKVLQGDETFESIANHVSSIKDLTSFRDINVSYNLDIRKVANMVVRSPQRIYESFSINHIALYVNESNIRSRGNDGNGVGDSTCFSAFNEFNLLHELCELLEQVKTQKAITLLRNLKNYTFNLTKMNVDYKLVLNDVYSDIKSDYDPRKLNRRYLYSGLLYPSMVGTKRVFVFAIDYSGSIKDHELAEQLGVIDDILSKHTNSEVHLMVFSDDIRKHLKLEEGETLLDSLNELGKGIGSQDGTNFQAVYDFIDGHFDEDEIRELSSVTIISSDGYGGPITPSEKFKDHFSGSNVMVFDANVGGTLTRLNQYEANDFKDMRFTGVLYNH